LHRELSSLVTVPIVSVSPQEATLVSVGIPTYNRPDGLRRTLECIVGQTYSNLEIIVSDNASTNPRVAIVAAEFQARDSRIRYVRQPANFGPTENFRFVLREATGEYFMWAADDDSWEPEFIARLAALLRGHPAAGVAFCNFDARDACGHRVNTYPDFLPLLKAYSAKPVVQRLNAYISQEESLGKANLLYGLYRRSILVSVGGIRAWGIGWWGADMLIACSVLARANVAIEPRLLYHVGTAPLGNDATQSASPIRSAWRPWRLAKAIGRHTGYMLGYARIIAGAPQIGLADRAALLWIVLRRIAAFVWKDLKNA